MAVMLLCLCVYPVLLVLLGSVHVNLKQYRAGVLSYRKALALNTVASDPALTYVCSVPVCVAVVCARVSQCCDCVSRLP